MKIEKMKTKLRQLCVRKVHVRQVPLQLLPDKIELEEQLPVGL